MRLILLTQPKFFRKAVVNFAIEENSLGIHCVLWSLSCLPSPSTSFEKKIFQVFSQMEMVTWFIDWSPPFFYTSFNKISFQFSFPEVLKYFSNFLFQKCYCYCRFWGGVLPENGWEEMSNCNQIHFKMFLFRVRYYKTHNIYNINSTMSVYRRYSERKIKFSLHLNINTWIEGKKKKKCINFGTSEVRLEARENFRGCLAAH